MRFRVALLVSTVLLIVGACGSDEDPSERAFKAGASPSDGATTEETPKPTKSPRSIAGTYSVNVAKKTAKGDAAGLAGKWEVTFSEDGTLSGSKAEGEGTLEGSYSVAGNEVTVTPSSEGCSEDATYRWKKSSQKLSLRKVTDSCLLTKTLFHYPLKVKA